MAGRFLVICGSKQLAQLQIGLQLVLSKAGKRDRWVLGIHGYYREIKQLTCINRFGSLRHPQYLELSGNNTHGDSRQILCFGPDY